MSKKTGRLSDAEQKRYKTMLNNIDSLSKEEYYEEFLPLSERYDFWENRTNGYFEPRACFVATACYGVNDVITETLRTWRDKQKSWLTTKFIELYYAGIGKKGAKVLNIFPFLKPLARYAIKIFMKIFRVK